MEEEKNIEEKTSEILEKTSEILEIVKSFKSLLEKSEKKPELTENKVIELLKQRRKITKQQVISISGVNPNSAKNYMEKLQSEEIRYVAGSGTRQSMLVLVEPGSKEAFAIDVIQTMKPKSQMTKQEAMEKYGLADESEAYSLFKLVKIFAPDEFFTDSGNLIRKA